MQWCPPEVVVWMSLWVPWGRDMGLSRVQGGCVQGSHSWVMPLFGGDEGWQERHGWGAVEKAVLEGRALHTVGIRRTQGSREGWRPGIDLKFPLSLCPEDLRKPFCQHLK